MTYFLIIPTIDFDGHHPDMGAELYGSRAEAEHRASELTADAIDTDLEPTWEVFELPVRGHALGN